MQYSIFISCVQVVDCLCGHLPSTECLSVAMELQHLCGGMSKEKVVARTLCVCVCAMFITGYEQL